MVVSLFETSTGKVNSLVYCRVMGIGEQRRNRW